MTSGGDDRHDEALCRQGFEVTRPGTPTIPHGKIRRLLVFGCSAFVLIIALLIYGQFRLRRIPIAMRPLPSGSGTDATLARHVLRLAADIGDRNYLLPESQKAAALYIADQFRLSGYEPIAQVYRVPGPKGEIELRNILVKRPGSQPQAPILVVGAHYDTFSGTPGADDNASGVAGLLELARRFHGTTGTIEMRFVAFDSEEPPFFGTSNMGSWQCAKALKDEKRQVKGMISLEMLGCYRFEKGSQQYPPPLGLVFPDRGDYIGAVADLGSRRFLSEFKSGFHAPKGTPLVAAALPRMVGVIEISDQLSFWKHGFPAFMVTDTAFLRNPAYHQPDDTPAKLDYVTMADVVDGLEAALRAMTR